VRQQVAELTRTPREPGLRRQAARSIRTRFHARTDRWVSAVSGHGAVETLVVEKEIIVTAATWADEGARAYLEIRGLRRVQLDAPGIDDRIVLLRAEDDLSADELDDTVAELRLRGFAASQNQVLPCNPVIKNLGGPALATPLEPFVRTPVPNAPHVAIVDTGITSQARTDGWLDDVPRHAHGPSANVDPLDFAPHDGYLDLCAGHGTFVAGVVARVAPMATVSVYRALLGGGVGSEIDVATAIVRAVEDGADIVNLSLGSSTLYDQPSLAVEAALDRIEEIEREQGREVLVVAAAGNGGDTRPMWPAAFRQVVAVAGLTANHHAAPWSSHGFWVDCSTVAEGICGPFVKGEESYEFTADPDDFPADSFALWSGTSFAAPQVAGKVAALMHEHGIGARRAYALLRATGTAIPPGAPCGSCPECEPVPSAMRTLWVGPGTIRPVTPRPSYETGPGPLPRPGPGPVAPAAPVPATDAAPHPTLTDLVAAAQSGDESAWREIVRRHTGLVLARIHQFRLTPQQAEDVAQTVWLNLCEHLGSIREPEALPGWISTTTRHECLRMTAATRRTILVDPTTDLDAVADEDEDGLTLELLREERHRALRSGLAELPDHQRRLLLLLSTDPPPTYQEVSEQLGMPVGSIGPTRQRGLERLRRTNALRGYFEASNGTAFGAGGRDVQAWG
jgi:RNA polymerase sigma factor (sigma-70 family)